MIGTEVELKDVVAFAWRPVGPGGLGLIIGRVLTLDEVADPGGVVCARYDVEVLQAGQNVDSKVGDTLSLTAPLNEKGDNRWLLRVREETLPAQAKPPRRVKLVTRTEGGKTFHALE